MRGISFKRDSLPLALSVILGACAGNPVADVVAPAAAPASLSDCRQPNPLFEAFAMSVKKVDWRGQKVTVTFAVTNVSKASASLMGSVADAAVSFPILNLANAEGVSYGSQPSNSIVMMGPVNPGITKEFVEAFEAPRGSYALLISRQTGAGGLIVDQPGVFKCSLRA